MATVRHYIHLLTCFIIFTLLASCGYDDQGSMSGNVSGRSDGNGATIVKMSIKTSSLKMTAGLKTEKKTLLARAESFLKKDLFISLATASAPPDVSKIIFTISGEGMDTMTKEVLNAGQNEISKTFDVPDGSNRHFVIEGRDTLDAPIYRGDKYADLNGGEMNLTIYMTGIKLTSDATATYQKGNTVTIKWATSRTNSSDAMVVSMKRDSASNLTEPDGVNWYRFTESASNTGDFQGTIPAAIADAADWRFYVKHGGSGAYSVSKIFTIGTTSTGSTSLQSYVAFNFNDSVSDSSTDGNRSGTIEGVASYAAGPTGRGNAANFNGSWRIVVNNSTSSNFSMEGNWTMAFSILTTGTSTWGNGLIQRLSSSGCAYRGFVIWDKIISAYNNNGIKDDGSLSALVNDQWNRVIIIHRSNDTADIYINGTKTGSNINLRIDETTAKRLSIGGNYLNDGCYGTGYANNIKLDDFIIFSGELSESQIASDSVTNPVGLGTTTTSGTTTTGTSETTTTGTATTTTGGTTTTGTTTSRYTNNGNGTVTDTTTNLMWQQGENPTTYNWYQASGTYDGSYNPTSISVCGSLSLSGYSNWRLPTIDELKTLIKVGSVPSIDTTYFPNVLSAYWSSTASTSMPSNAWVVNFSDAYNFNEGNVKRSNLYVRCVR